MKRKDQKEKTSLLSDLRAFFRAVEIGYRLDRKFFFMQTVNGASFIFRNMITNIIAALVINGVYRGESEQTLMLYALVAVFANFLLNLAVLFTANRRYIRKSMWTMFISRFFNRCSEKMDYAHFEDIRVKDMRRRIDRYNSRWQGIANFWAWYYVVVAFTGVAANVTILSTMLFRFDHSHTEGILWFVNTPYALVLFLAVLVGYYLFSVWYNQYTKRVSVDYDEHWTKNGRRMMTMLGYPTDTKRAMDMKIYGLDRAIYQTVSDFAANDKKATGDAHLKYGLSNVLNSIAYYGLMFFSYAFVGLKVLSGAFGIGSLVLYVTTMLGFADAFREFGETVGVIQGSRKVYDDEFGYIDMENKMQKGSRLPDLEKPGHTVEFRNVSFKYPAAETYALSHVNISFGLSERLAVVGMNGSGKTTFLKLLCRLYDPDEGEILLDGVNIKEYDYGAYLKLFSVVFQDFKLFSLPLCENVAAGRGVDRSRVKKSLEKAGVYDRVKAMPKGMDTCLYKQFDPEGIEISGGEAQKIALARALYKDAPIVVLDEPTASLDPLAEAEIYASFNEMMEGKTAVYISHRLSSCRFCSRIAVFDKGELVQIGTHDGLLSENGKYAELWHAQAQYYTDHTT